MPIVDGGELPDAGLEDGGIAPIDGIVFVHGINGSGANWDVMRERFKADGWPEERPVARTFKNPSWGCNTTNARHLDAWVGELEALGARRIAIVAHSMGGLSSRSFVKSLGGTGRVSVYTSPGTMHHGLRNPCTAPIPICVWPEWCSSGTFLADLNATPATPRPTAWTSILSDSDDTVPQSSSELEGANHILVNGLEHDGVNGLQDSEEVYRLVVQSLQ